MEVRFWKAGGSENYRLDGRGAGVEAEGWDGQMFMDSQSLCADPYARMGVWAAATERLGLSTSVTSPLTHHPAVTTQQPAATLPVHLARARGARHRPG